MNITLNLTDEQASALQSRTDQANTVAKAAAESRKEDAPDDITPEQYLANLLQGAAQSWVNEDIRNTALGLEAAARQLPDDKRIAFTGDVYSLFQEYASGAK